MSAWRAAQVAAGAAFLRSCDGPLHDAIEAAERGLEALLDDERAHQPAAHALAWLDVDPVAGKLYIDFFGAASPGVAPGLGAKPPSHPAHAVVLTPPRKEPPAQP